MNLDEKQTFIIEYCEFNIQSQGRGLKKCIGWLYINKIINKTTHDRLILIEEGWKTYEDSNHILLINLLNTIINEYNRTKESNY
jgi:hypothetical protein